MATAAPARSRGPVPGHIILRHPLILLLVLNWVVPILTSELLTIVRNEAICKSIDIRNRLESFDQLKGCKIIEGSLQILLFDNVNETDFSNISFPELTEITDYLLLFRVNGLKSIGQLFPNLTVIRGQNLVPGLKALVIFEMSSLVEIGLHSLTDIMQGAVHIDKNPSLCFINTIDWKKIVHDQSSHMYIKSLKPENECPVCPHSANGQECPQNEDDEGKYLCWNRNYCQKLCNHCNGTCNANGTCCDDHCIGGCAEDTTKCSVCRNYALTDIKNGLNQCVKNCPPGFYTYLGRRCVTRNECINTTGPLNPQSNDGEVTNYKIFNDSCVLTCPTNYADDLNHSCKKCDNTCRKECPGARIDSINLAYELRGCTHITSSLEIQIRGGHKVVKVLEENLGMIEEIDGYLKVVRSFSLVSLSFFKNLKRINGKFLDSQRYSLVILDNQNLQDLFDWETHKDFKIKNGSLFFHFNPKLCISKIEKLREIAGLPDFTEMEVAPSSNGDKVACNVTEIKVTATSITSKSAVLVWEPFEIDDSRKLLSYIVYRIEAPQKTVNFYDGRDACGQDNWHVDDVANTADKKSIIHPLTNLKPYTQYAFYVKTYTIATEKYGAQSKISYFSTAPSQPSTPRQLEVTSNSSDSLLVSWRPPVDPNGELSHYIVSGVKQPIYTSTNRDYCKDVVTPTIPKKTPNVEVPRKSPNNHCEASDDKNSLKIYDEQEEINRISFENELHNKVYVKRSNRSRSTRSIGSTSIMIDKDSLNASSDFDKSDPFSKLVDGYNDLVINNKTDNQTNTWISFNFPIYTGVGEFYINKLHHYTSYEITVKACRKAIENDTEPLCSEALGQTASTLKKVGADNITNVTVSNITSDSVTVNWVQPSEPNGMIVSVTILYKREGNKNAQYTGECISFMDFPHFSKDNKSINYTISKLTAGNHSLCLKASSFAGIGDVSQCVNFIIPEGTSNAIVIVSCVLTLLLLIVSAVLYWFYRRTLKERNTMRLIPSVNPEYVSGVYVPDEWEVPRKSIEFIRELGQGSFGMVWEGIAYDIRGQPSVRCAVKTVNEHATNRERVDFLNEASVMKAFDTTHVVRLLGVVSQSQPTLVVMELMAQGDLKTYLRSHRPENSDRKSAPTLRQILQMAIEIADGMAYLEAKKFVHRDLAARNCMVSENLIVKIGDFGMTRDIYETDYYRKGSKGLLPVRWMAPESLKDGVFSSSSDVWSYGVVLWEMSTLASQPYQGLANDQVLRYVIEGGVMERPENCPDKLYDLMRCCWVNKPSRRPTFMKLCQLLLPDSHEFFKAVSFYHSPAGNEARTARSAAVPNPEHVEHEVDGEDADASTPLNGLPPDVRLARAFGMTASGRSDSGHSVQLDPNPRFYSISEERTANGFVANRAKNGKPQSQC